MYMVKIYISLWIMFSIVLRRWLKHGRTNSFFSRIPYIFTLSVRRKKIFNKFRRTDEWETSSASSSPSSSLHLDAHSWNRLRYAYDLCDIIICEQNTLILCAEVFERSMRAPTTCISTDGRDANGCGCCCSNYAADDITYALYTNTT